MKQFREGKLAASYYDDDDDDDDCNDNIHRYLMLKQLRKVL